MSKSVFDNKWSTSRAGRAEAAIVHESPNGIAWVRKDKNVYSVFINGATHATSDSAYSLNDDGLSIAKARADYLDKRRKK